MGKVKEEHNWVTQTHFLTNISPKPILPYFNDSNLCINFPVSDKYRVTWMDMNPISDQLSIVWKSIYRITDVVDRSFNDNIKILYRFINILAIDKIN